MERDQARERLYHDLTRPMRGGWKTIYGTRDGSFVRLYIALDDEVENITGMVADAIQVTKHERKGAWYIRTNTSGNKVQHICDTLAVALRDWAITFCMEHAEELSYTFLKSRMID